eukprot:gene3132-3410_t
MNKLLLAALLGLLLLSAPFIRADDDEYEDDAADEKEGAAAGSEEEKDVVVITQKNFDDVVKKSKFALVEFYAPWCGHCQKLKPEWAKAATAMKAHDDTVVVGMVDATAESDLGQKFGVQGYPTIKWFVDGEMVSDYSGPREADGIVKWLKKKTGPAAATLADKDALATAEKDNEVLVLGYFKDFKGADYDAFIKVAQKTEDATFVQTKEKDVAKAAGLTKHTVAVITNFEGEERTAVPVDGKITEESVTKLLNVEKMPPTIPFSDKNSQKIFNSGIDKQLLLVAKAKDLKADAKLFKAFREVAASKKGKLVFVTVDADGSGKDPVMNFFGLKDEDTPAVIGFHMANNKKFRLREDKLDAKTIGKFAEGVLDGTVTAEYKSAPIPDEPTEGGVTIVVGKNFEEIVKDEGKDVLLEVYAPWCGHCKALDPVYKKLAKRFAKVDSVVIAKMDGTENEHADVEVKGFPTILFFPAGADKKVVSFSGGDRSLKALTKFVKKNAKIKFDLPKKKKADAEDESEEKEAKEEEAGEEKDEL